MKKFNGTVNGKSFDNEKDFNEAAAKAIAENDGNLAISSYYSYTSDENEELKGCIPSSKKEKSVLTKDKYFLAPDAKPLITNFDKRVYVISEEVKSAVKDADNKDEIIKSLNGKIGNICKQIKDVDTEINDIQKEIDTIQNRIGEKVETLRDLKGQRTYYNNLLEIATDIESCAAEDTEEAEHKTCDCGCSGKCKTPTFFDALSDLMYHLSDWRF